MSDNAVSSFLARLEATGAVSAELWQANFAGKSFASDKDAAKTAIEAGVLTRWQASRLLAGKSEIAIGDYELLDRLPVLSESQVYVARRGHEEPIWLEVIAADVAAEVTPWLHRAVDGLLTPRGVEVVEGRSLVDHGPVHGQPLAVVLKKSPKLPAAEMARVVRDVAAVLREMHESQWELGRLTPTQLVKSGSNYQLTTWGIWSGCRTDADPFVDGGDAGPLGTQDLFGLGMTGLAIGAGTLKRDKVRPANRLEKWFVAMTAPERGDAPSTRPSSTPRSRAFPRIERRRGRRPRTMKRSPATWTSSPKSGESKTAIRARTCRSRPS